MSDFSLVNSIAVKDRQFIFSSWIVHTRIYLAELQGSRTTDRVLS